MWCGSCVAQWIFSLRYRSARPSASSCARMPALLSRRSIAFRSVNHRTCSRNRLGSIRPLRERHDAALFGHPCLRCCNRSAERQTLVDLLSDPQETMEALLDRKKLTSLPGHRFRYQSSPYRILNFSLQPEVVLRQFGMGSNLKLILSIAKSTALVLSRKPKSSDVKQPSPLLML